MASPETTSTRPSTIPNRDLRIANLRENAAGEIKKARKAENSPLLSYQTFRGAAEYVTNLYGIAHTLEHAPKGRPILDVGTGRGFAIQELKESPLGKERQFIAIGLKHYPSIESTIGEENFHITSAETLRGIENNSIGAILGAYSVAYSEAPTLVANRFDEVLVPGGLIKLSFFSDGKQEPFIERLKALGYDVATYQDEKKLQGNALVQLSLQLSLLLEPHSSLVTNAQYTNSRVIVLAIKPGGEQKVSAQQILDEDRWSTRKQAGELKALALRNRTLRSVARSLARQFKMARVAYAIADKLQRDSIYGYLDVEG
jgi:hypothetical protein